MEKIDKFEDLKPTFWDNRESKDSGSFAGIEYDTDLAGSSGVTVVLLPHPGHTAEEIEDATNEAYGKRDVVEVLIQRVPKEWYEADVFVPSGESAGWIEAARWITKHKQYRRVIPTTGELVPEKKNGGILLDLFTASALCAVYDRLNASNQEKFRMMDVRKAASVAFKLIK